MVAAEKSKVLPDDPPALKTALSLLTKDLWPIPIHPPGTTIGVLKDGSPKISKGKEPIGDSWGLTKHTPETLRALFTAIPTANLGIKLGKEGGVIDIEADGDPEIAKATLEALFGGEEIVTVGWSSTRGFHLLFRYDIRLERYKAIIKGDWLPGLEIRVGAIGSTGQQYQSVCPPSRSADGEPRRWNGHAEIGELPDTFFAYLDCHMPRVVAPKIPPPRILKFTGPIPSGTWDKDDVLEAARPHFKDLATEWGVKFTGKIFDGSWAECHAIDRPDRTPSAGLNLQSGVYHDFGTETPGLSFFNLGLSLGAFPDFPTAVNSLGSKLAVPPVKTNEGSDGSEGKRYKNSSSNGHLVEAPVWKPPRLKQDISAEPFPLDVLPTSLAEFCREGAAAVQCPVDYFGAASVAFAGAAIGLSVNLTVKAHYTEAPNLYLAIVGPPGKKKSPVLKILARPLYAIDREMREAYRVQMGEYEEERREFEVAKKKGDAGEAPDHPIQVQLTLDDTTREAVAQVHSENPRGLVLIKDELTSLVASLDAYRAGKGDDKQFWLKVNSGILVKVNRKGAKEPLIVPQPCVSIVGGLTPDMLPSIKSHGDDGWLDRILFAYPEPIASADWSDAVIPDGLLEDWSAAIRRLWSRPMTRDEDGHARPYFIHLDEGAINLWREWINGHRKEQGDPDFPKSLEGPWSKMEGFAARLALILSQLHQAYDPTDERLPRNVSPLDMWGARKLADYFKAHFRRAKVDLIARSDLPDDCMAIIKWLKHSGRSSFSERDAKLNFPRRFGSNPLAMSDAAEWLIRRGCVRLAQIEDKGIGRPHSPVYEVNPFLLGTDPND
jgi:hypothetical protein